MRYTVKCEGIADDLAEAKKMWAEMEDSASEHGLLRSSSIEDENGDEVPTED